MNSFYTSPRRTERSTTILQCSLKSSTLTPKTYSPWNIFPNGLPVSLPSHRYSYLALPIGPNRYGPRLAQQMRPIRSSACSGLTSTLMPTIRPVSGSSQDLPSVSLRRMSESRSPAATVLSYRSHVGSDTDYRNGVRISEDP